MQGDQYYNKLIVQKKKTKAPSSSPQGKSQSEKRVEPSMPVLVAEKVQLTQKVVSLDVRYGLSSTCFVNVPIRDRKVTERIASGSALKETDELGKRLV